MIIEPGFGTSSSQAPEFSQVRVEFQDLGRRVNSVSKLRTRYDYARLVEYRFGRVSVITQEPWRYLLDGKVPPESVNDKYSQVTAGEDGRPDKFARRVYGAENEVYWWFILAANGMNDFEDMVAGQTLRVPPMPFVTSSPEFGV